VTDKALETAARKLAREKIDDLLEAVGAGEISARRVVEAIYPPQDGEAVEPRLEPDAPTVRGVRRGVATRFGACCKPIPGDRIVGIQDGAGVVIHAIDCPTLERHEEELSRWLDLRWDEEAASAATHSARIALTLANEPGALARICALIAEQRANIDFLATAERTPDFFRMILDVEVRDVKHLAGILSALEAQPMVSAAARARGDDEETTAAPALAH
jgi:GTP pyrophosphokinase